MLKKFAQRLVVVLVGALPLLAQPVPAAAAAAGTLFVISGNQDVLNRYDLVSGTLTPIANLAGPNQGQTGTLTVDPIAHLLYGVRTSVTFTPPSSILITNEVLTINSVTGAFTVSKPVNAPVGQVLFDPSDHALLILGALGIFKVDPVTGGTTPLTHLDRELNSALTSMALDASTHTLYVNAELFLPDGNFTSNILTIDSHSGALMSNVPLGQQIGVVGFDSSSGVLLTAGGFPPRLAQVDPVAGTVTPIASVTDDPDVQLGFAMSVDSSSHTVFLEANTFQCCWTSQSQVVAMDASGTPTFGPLVNDNLWSLQWEPDVTVTPDGIKADVVSGGITKAGVAKTLLADLSDAQAARERGQCKTAANGYQQFINDVNAQTGKSISVATASRLVSEAQFLIANCP